MLAVDTLIGDFVGRLGVEAKHEGGPFARTGLKARRCAARLGKPGVFGEPMAPWLLALKSTEPW
jgi:hypothetical protein